MIPLHRARMHLWNPPLHISPLSCVPRRRDLGSCARMTPVEGSPAHRVRVGSWGILLIKRYQRVTPIPLSQVDPREEFKATGASALLAVQHALLCPSTARSGSRGARQLVPATWNCERGAECRFVPRRHGQVGGAAELWPCH